MSTIDIINLASNIVISTSCFVISLFIARFVYVRRNDGIPFRMLFVLMAMLFFFGGGARYVMIIYPNQIIDTIARAFTALTSLAFAISISWSMSEALKMKTPMQYDRIDKEKELLLKTLKDKIKLLESKIDHGRSAQRA